ncbi:GmrSD restriction endonuclease domain-containing protein, partial [Aetokthonos hydrillicola]
MTESFSPLVQDTTKAQSESIETVLSRLKSGRVYIPDYQRDAEQWKCEKKALFIESILNNLTIPAFFFCEDDNRNYEVVDGQQRLSTIWDFSENKLTMNDSLKIDYMSPASALYAGKTYSNLIPTLKNIFNDYPLTIIYLPKSLPLQTKLEIFRRINEGGTPLSGQDIRLAYYIRSKSVTFIRVVGIYSSSTDSIEDTVETEAEPEFIKKPFQRMIELAEGKGIPNPWDNF